MPIAKPTPIATASPQLVTEPTVTSNDYRHAVVDSQYVPMNALLTHLPGMKLTTTYYHQVMGRDEEPSPFDPTQQGPYQQYRKIVNFEILLQGSLSTDIDTETQTTRITGNAILYPGLVPIDGDAFIMDTGDGRASQCTVLNAKRLTYFRDAAFEINFVVSRFVTPEIDRLINDRVVLTHYFHKDFLTHGQNPFLVEEEHNFYLELDKAEENLTNYWTRQFWNPTFGTFTVPSQWGQCYDPFFTKFIIDLLPIYDFNEYRHVRLLNCDDFNFNNLDSVWDMLLKRDTFYLNSIFKEASLISVKSLNNRPLMNGVYYSGMDNLVGPSKVDRGYGVNAHDYSNSYGWNISWSCCPSLNDYTAGLGFKEDITIPDGEGTNLPILFKENFYVFTQAFYEGKTEEMSTFERLLYKGMNKEAIHASDIIPFYRAIHKWSRLDQFYLIPTLILIIKYAQRSI